MTGSHVNRPLNTKLIKTTPPKTLFFFVGGMTIAKNMPYNATLSALTAEAGRIFPATIPIAVADDHAGSASAIAP